MNTMRTLYNKMKTIRIHIFVVLLSVFLAMSSLVTAAYLPQWLIEDNLWDSLPGLYAEGDYPVIFDHRINSLLDNYSDIYMLRASAGTSSNYLGSILTNPIYIYNLEDDIEQSVNVKNLEMLISGEQPDSYWCYCRYWMGFRVILRFLLVFLDYFQIRRYVSVLFFTLFFAVVCSIAKHLDHKIAFIFAFSLVLVRPQIIATSLQYTCCFLIAFCAMLAIPWLKKNPKVETIFFMEIGIITMFFDFYTVPLVTMGLPLVYLYALKIKEAETVSLKWILKNLLIWLTGYAVMWLMKLILTSTLTSVNALYDGISSFFSRIGIFKDADLEQYYDFSMAFDGIKEAIFTDNEGKVIYLTGTFVLVLAVCIKVIQKKIYLHTFLLHRNMLAIALLPLIWFFITAQPIAIHYCFQYRTIVLTHWAIGTYIWMVMESQQNEVLCTKDK